MLVFAVLPFREVCSELPSGGDVLGGDVLIIEAMSDFPGDLPNTGPDSGETGSDTSAIVARCRLSPFLFKDGSNSGP